MITIDLVCGFSGEKIAAGWGLPRSRVDHGLRWKIALARVRTGCLLAVRMVVALLQDDVRI